MYKQCFVSVCVCVCVKQTDISSEFFKVTWFFFNTQNGESFHFVKINFYFEILILVLLVLINQYPVIFNIALFNQYLQQMIFRVLYM